MDCNCISFHYIFAMTMFERTICRCCDVVVCCICDRWREKKEGKKEEKKKKKRRKNQLFCYILRPIFVGGACGGLYGRGALAPPHNPSDPTKLALRLISTHYSMLGDMCSTHPHISSPQSKSKMKFGCFYRGSNHFETPQTECVREGEQKGHTGL